MQQEIKLNQNWSLSYGLKMTTLPLFWSNLSLLHFYCYLSWNWLVENFLDILMDIYGQFTYQNIMEGETVNIFWTHIGEQAILSIMSVNSLNGLQLETEQFPRKCKNEFHTFFFKLCSCWAWNSILLHFSLFGWWRRAFLFSKEKQIQFTRQFWSNDSTSEVWTWVDNSFILCLGFWNHRKLSNYHFIVSTKHR